MDIHKKVKLAAIKRGLSMVGIAKLIKTESGTEISKQRFCDMIKGRRPSDIKKYKSQIAEILGLKNI